MFFLREQPCLNDPLGKPGAALAIYCTCLLCFPGFARNIYMMSLADKPSRQVDCVVMKAYQSWPCSAFFGQKPSSISLSLSLSRSLSASVTLFISLILLLTHPLFGVYLRPALNGLSFCRGSEWIIFSQRAVGGLRALGCPWALLFPFAGVQA